MRQPVFIALTLAFILLSGWAEVYAQSTTRLVGDTSKTCDTAAARKHWAHNIFRQAWNSIQKDPNDCDASEDDGVLNARGEEMYKPYEGKYIRYIYIEKFNFERNFQDTSRSIKSLGTRLANSLHSTTRDWVIRNNLYIREGDRLDAYEIADNERYLRTLDYLQDARINILPVRHTDTVDLLVITKDVFSIKADVNNAGIQMINPRLAENNFMGTGHRIFGGVLWDPSRSPIWGYDAGFTLRNLGGSFFNVTADHNTINNGTSIGLEEEVATLLRIERPLISPYSKYAGALEISTNHSINSTNKPDSLFAKYTYQNFDIWGGYNLCLDHVLQEDHTIRDRKFLSLRYFVNHFTDNPVAFESKFDPIYNDKTAVLGSLTFFRQDFIKTQYIYGFGITEDVPYGYNVTVTGGWWKQLNLQRPYAGLNVDYFFAHGDGSFAQYYLRTGSFLNDGKLQDASLLAGISYFSPIVFSGDFKIRQYIRATYSQLFNPLTYEPLRINNVYGLRDFGSDSVWGNQRISLQTETSFFTRYKYYGFKIAPFIYADASFIRGADAPFNKGDIYPGIGGGIRARNENLIFGTIELKGIWFPRPVVGNTTFRITLNSGLRYRYNTQYVHAPDIARLNWDYNN